MTTFHLTVVTPDGCAFEGQAERVVCRAIDGDLAILAKHGDYCTARPTSLMPRAAAAVPPAWAGCSPCWTVRCVW